MSLTFQYRQTPTGEYWRVLWNGRQAGILVPIGFGPDKEVFVLKHGRESNVELTRAKTVFEAKEFLRARVKERG